VPSHIGDLVERGAVIFGTPTRFGNMAGQMRQFLDGTGSLWAKASSWAKLGACLSAPPPTWWPRVTILSFHTTLLHHGMVIVGLPYAFQGQMRLDEITAGRRMGVHDRWGKGERMASENELAAARFRAGTWPDRAKVVGVADNSTHVSCQDGWVCRIDSEGTSY